MARDEIALSGGRTATRETVNIPAPWCDSADRDGEVTLVRQYRHSSGATCLSSRRRSGAGEDRSSAQRDCVRGGWTQATDVSGQLLLVAGFRQRDPHVFLAETCVPATRHR